MGFLRDIFSGRDNALLDAAQGPSFADDAESIPPEVFGLTAYVSPTAPAPKIDRRSAMSVPAVKRSRDLIVSTLGGLPLDLIGPNHAAGQSSLFEQPEKNVPRSVTMTRTFEDLFFEGIAWWRIVEFGWHTYPTKVKRIDPKRVTVNEDLSRVYIDGQLIPDSELIRFDSPTDGLLIAGARAIRTCLTLDAAASRYAEGAPPLDYFSPADGADPVDDEEVLDILDAWRSARQTRSTGYVPAALKYNIGGWSPEQLQLSDARQHAVLEIARVAGIDAEELGVSTTSRTYANQFDRRKAFLDFTLGQYRQAMEDRLSMGDVTPRGSFAKFNMDAFLRSSTLERYQAMEVGLRIGAIDPSEIRPLEDKPQLAVQPAPQAAGLSAPIEATFDDEPVIRLDSPQDPSTFQVDVERRIIRGLAVPYGSVGLSNGQSWQFSQGTIQFADVRRVKLWVQHDKTQAVGVATELEDRPEGLFATFKVARGPEGDRALSLAEDGVLDGLSIGLKQGGKFQTRDGVNHAVVAPLMEISLTPAPSFDDARVHAVAASAVPTTGEDMPEDQLTTEGPQDFSAITDAISQGFAGLAIPQRETVAAGGETFQVDEQPLYRFDGIMGQRSLTEDMRDALHGDSDARQRIDGFFNEQFAVTSTNVTSLNPVQNKPELYVGSLPYTRPLWDLVTNGSIDDKTPFTVPKFSSASGLVGPHTEGTEPTPGSFSATVQTITPSAVSGKIEINREVLDQGGSPQADQIIWNEMLNGWYEGIEARIATALAAVGTAEVNLASAVDSVLVDGLQNILVGLQFARGGNRFTGLALDGQLFPALVDAADTTGRKLLPVIGPTNAQGQVAGGFDRVSIGGLQGVAAWALGATNASKSYLLVPSSVYAWASTPKRFQFEYQLKSIDLGIWGYAATAVTRDSDVKPIDYTTAD